MMRRLSVLAAVATLTLCGVVRAQETLLPLPVENLTIGDALAKSKREHRVLVVVREWKRPPQGRRPWWANDALRAWLAWHAVIVELKPGDVEAGAYLQGVPRDSGASFWGIDIFIDGKRVTLKCPPITAPVCMPACDPPKASGPDDWADSGRPCLSPTATSVLGQLEFHRACAAERIALWAQLHEIDCPEPKRPGRLYWYALEKDGYPRVSDARTPADGDRYVDVLARIHEADRLIAGKKYGEALALLTWAWERGGEVDPAFELARVGVILPRLIDLRLRDAGVKERMSKIADAEFTLYPWFDDHEELGYLALRWACGEAGQSETRLAVENVDLDEETMGAIVGLRTGNLKARVAQLPLMVPPAPGAWSEILTAARERIPVTTDAEPRARWGRARVQMLAMGAVRPYAMLLSSASATDRARAAQIAADVIKTSADAPPALRAAVLRAIVFAAASVGKADETHRAWLDEAAELDPPVEGKDKRTVDPLTRTVNAGQPEGGIK